VRLAESEDGVELEEVISEEPAARAGLQSGDVVLEADGEPVESANDIQNAVAAKKPGDKVQLKVRRGDDELTVTVTLGTRPPTAE
jgi:S1-C subfamily serine protease